MEHEELDVSPGAGPHLLPRLLVGGDQHQQVEAASHYRDKCVRKITGLGLIFFSSDRSSRNDNLCLSVSVKVV